MARLPRMACALAVAAFAPASASAATLELVSVPGGKQVRYVAGPGELNFTTIQLWDAKVTVQEGINYGVTPVTAVSPCEAEPQEPASSPMYTCPAVDVQSIYVDLGDQNDYLSFGAMGALGIPVTAKLGAGNDDAWTRDSFADRVDCGLGTDHIRADSNDLLTDCETAEGGADTRERADGIPIGVTINDGDSFTNNPNVTVTAYGPDAATAVLLDNDGGFAHAFSFPVASPDRYDWKLDSSDPERLPKTVYARFSGPGVDGTKTFSDDIILDETPPVLTAATLRGGTLRVTARDATSGLGSMQWRFKRGGKGSSFRPFKAKLRLQGRIPHYVRARDRAANLSRWLRISR